MNAVCLGTDVNIHQTCAYKKKWLGETCQSSNIVSVICDVKYVWKQGNVFDFSRVVFLYALNFSTWNILYIWLQIRTFLKGKYLSKWGHKKRRSSLARLIDSQRYPGESWVYQFGSYRVRMSRGDPRRIPTVPATPRSPSTIPQKLFCFHALSTLLHSSACLKLRAQEATQEVRFGPTLAVSITTALQSESVSFIHDSLCISIQFWWSPQIIQPWFLKWPWMRPWPLSLCKYPFLGALSSLHPHGLIYY